jgi:glycosyltransferase involved in cell wall biosynthesis
MNTLKKIRLKFSSLEFYIIRSRAKLYGYSLVGYLQPTYNELVLENIFKTNFTKYALLSYIVEPFKDKISLYHSNHQECNAIAEILKELEYNVDVINWDNSSYLPNKDYDLVIDNHNNLQRLSPWLQKTTYKIFHATNTYWLFQNTIEYKRCLSFFENEGVMITPNRLRPEGNSIAFADAVSMFGNGFTAATYGAFKDKIIQLPMSVTVQPVFDSNKSFRLSKKKFLWLNSHGALLKGLDVLIKVFLGAPQFELFICYNESQDQQFFKAMEIELASSRNIHLLGWVDIEGSLFKDLISKCCWVISTSWSEGGGGSILNCMGNGLIPVITRSCSISLPANCGYYIDNENLGSITNCLSEITTIGDDRLAEMSENSVAFIRENHSIENFRNKYREFIIDVIKGPEN